MPTADTLKSKFQLFARLYHFYTSQPGAEENFKYLPYGPFASEPAFTQWYIRNMQPNRGTCWFAILVKKKGMQSIEWRSEEFRDPMDSTFAGSIALLNCDEKMAVGEIGHVSLVSWEFRSPSHGTVRSK